MAFVVDEFTDNSSDARTEVAVPIPAHQAGDVLLAFAQQDGGTGVFSTASSAELWNNAFPTAQVAANAQRTYGWYRIAQSDSEADLVVTSTLSDQIAVSVLVIRGADQTTPIEVSAIGAVAKSYAMMPPSVVTSTNGCLLIYGMGTDHSTSIHYADVREIVRVTGGNTTNGELSVGYINQQMAGTRPAVGFANFGTAGGQAFIVAIRDDGTNRRRSSLAQFGDVIRRCGLYGANRGDPADTWEAPSAVAASIGGIVCDGTAPSVTASNTTNRVNFNYDATAYSNGTLQGAFRVFAAPVDMSGGLFKTTLDGYNIRSQYHTPVGYVLCFVDSSGNYKAFNFDARAFGYLTSWAKHVLIDLVDFPAWASSGAVDWTSIAKVGFLFNKLGIVGGDTGSISAAEMAILREGSVILRGGRGQSDFTLAADVNALFDGWGSGDAAASQGSGQGLLYAPVQFGDASGAATIEMAGASLEDQKPFAKALSRRFNLVNTDPTPWSVKAVAGDSISFAGGLIVANTRRQFLIHSSTSASADITFNGAVIKGFEVVNSVSGVVIDNATLLGCYKTTLNGGGLSGCLIRDARENVAVSTSDPSNIVDCTFIAPVSGGHAIEITQPGTYTFEGNTFEGYGVDGSTDAAIYNNSGGAVTLNITGGGDTPTVRNGTGASTTVNSGATLTLTGLEPGSDIVILDAGTTTERVNVDANAGTTYAYGYTATGSVDIGVFKAGFVPLYIRGLVLTTSDSSLPIDQIPDRNYSNPA